MPPTNIKLNAPQVISRIANDADRRLAWEFFVFFSRFEYALKRHECYLLSGEGNAEANWNRYASDHNNRFNPTTTETLLAAVDYFRNRPPKKQLRKNGKMHWSDPQTYDEKEPLLIWLIRCVRTVRNNLFHGGKFPETPVSDPSRDRELLAHALIILNASLNLNPEVTRIFIEGIDE